MYGDSMGRRLRYRFGIAFDQEEIRETVHSSYRARELDCATPVGGRDNEMRKIESRVCDVPQLNPLVAGRCVGARPRYFIYEKWLRCDEDRLVCRSSGESI